MARRLANERQRNGLLASCDCVCKRCAAACLPWSLDLFPKPDAAMGSVSSDFLVFIPFKFLSRLIPTTKLSLFFLWS